MKIVKFPDGKYAVRRWVPFKWQYLAKYITLSDPHEYWFTLNRKLCCVVDTYEEAVFMREALFAKRKQKKMDKHRGTPVKSIDMNRGE